MEDLAILEDRLGYKFKNRNNLELALTHSSYANEHNLESNERLEFLGDAVLELAMSKHLYNSIDLDEGILTKTRAKAVCELALDLYASNISLPEFLILGRGDEIIWIVYYSLRIINHFFKRNYKVKKEVLDMK